MQVGNKKQNKKTILILTTGASTSTSRVIDQRIKKQNIPVLCLRAK